MIRKTKSGYRLYSRKKNPKTGKRRNLGTFSSLAKAKKHEKAVQFFKRAGECFPALTSCKGCNRIALQSSKQYELVAHFRLARRARARSAALSHRIRGFIRLAL